MDPFVKVSLITGFLAAAASLVNAFVSVFNAIRDNRSLSISLVPTEFDVNTPQTQYSWFLRIVNPAKSSNFIKEMRCSIGDERLPCHTEPVDLLGRPIEAYQAVGGGVIVAYQRVEALQCRQAIRFLFVPVRGRKVTRKFTRADLIHPG
jgi:hypothetical protein